MQSLSFDGERVVLAPGMLGAPPAGHVCIRSEWTQVSIGTETAWIREHAAARRPVALGYSHVGIIETIGPDVTGWEVGQRVLSCSAHASRVHARCDELVRVPDGLGADLACIGVIGSIAYHIVQRAAPRMLEATAVIGQGVVGSLVLQVARACGVDPLIAIDADASRLVLARRLGAETIDASREDVVERVRVITGGAGVSLCIEAANTAKVFASAIAMLALRGRLITTSTVYAPVPIRIMEDMIERELTITGAHQPKCPAVANAYHPWTQLGNRLAAMRAMRDGTLTVDALISHRERPADAPALYDRLIAGDRTIVGALIDWR
ncbi:MAG: zinc-binding alcohol dehydrogenase [Planctomycetes bacterium]|nr:zinc-binding alcohol dehydrogenase [Planctomycetota bacterium]